MKYKFSKLWSTQFWGFYQFKSFLKYASDRDSQVNYYRTLEAFQTNVERDSKSDIPQDKRFLKR